jgi:hypothetical protein
MSPNFRVRRVIFGEQKLIFVIERIDNGEFFECPVAELFRDDELLSELSYSDVRMIGYFAAIDESQLDQEFLHRFVSEK